MNLLQLIRSFVCTVEAGSIAGGARSLGISAAAVSQNIARLEAELGVRLLNRSPRSLALTERGARYFEQVREIDRQLERAHQAATVDDEAPSGRLRIASSGAFARHVLAPMLPSLRARHPRLELELRVEDGFADHARDGLDASLRIQEQLEDTVVARCIAVIPFVLCAAPDYMARHGSPSNPEQLAAHDCVLFRQPADGRHLRWGFVRDGQRIVPELKPALVSNDIDAIAAMTAAGAGISRLAAFVAEPYLAQGTLVALTGQERVAQFDAEPEPMRIHMCLSDRRDLTPKLQSFLQHLHSCLPAAWRQPLADGNGGGAA
ncbi:LysR family transcriptional regulator [Pseudoxanthomonas sp.]|uniref:LysR family transcriptional regulator n=1 Tax=Pseudoxanthomonas sp. TaxID=1871049 RepID=UPI0026290A1D|nr:LysR family transcriptional regulator [Pseudoxanthomonas sp.]WDS34978.1 MAG: LysR substrate-binding domain-containing protein [Pseudoxanthomonas sp.]